MVIDLQRCVGCGACAFACKAENNTRTRGEQQSFNWADFVTKTEGTFPNVKHVVMPVLCNHCSDAPCVKVCPTEPKAMFKTPEGITLHDSELCIGCRRCQRACPYSNKELGEESLDGTAYSVISFNPDGKPVQPQAKAAGAATPTLNAFVEGDEKNLRPEGVVEKCTFCYHRTLKGLQPACVEVCPSKARIFGDQDDPKSEIAQILKAQKSFRLQEEKGTKPNVHYINSYSART
jgi:Fe-S-cluster-containing dehydrogenase component